MSLKRKALSGLVWTGIDSVLLKGAIFAAQLLLARLLGPKEFGLIGMIAIFTAIGGALIDSGLSMSLVRTKDLQQIDSSTIFFTNILLGAIVYTIAYAIAPLIAKFYSQKILINIVRLYCFGFIISSFSAVQIAVLTREMKFRKLMFLNFPGTIIGIFIGLFLGFQGWGVWSIVWMYLSTQICQSILLWIFSGWKPSFIFSFSRLRTHLDFSYKLLISGLLNTSFDNIYNVIIGKYYSVIILGFYERAFLLNQYPVAALTAIVDRVTYPILANVRNEKERVNLIYQHILQITFFITAPFMLGAAAIAKPLFLLLLGKQWLPAVPFFQIICLGSIFYPIHAFNTNVLKVFGRSDLFLKLEVIKKIFIIFIVFIAFKFGIYGLVWSNVLVSYIALVINTHYSNPLINYSTKKQFKDIFPILILSILTAVIMAFLVHLTFGKITLIAQIFLIIFLGCIIYLAVNYFLKITAFNRFINIFNHKSI